MAVSREFQTGAVLVARIKKAVNTAPDKARVERLLNRLKKTTKTAASLYLAMLTDADWKRFQLVLRQ